MYNRLCQYLTEHNILCSNQFGSQTGHSTRHAIVQIPDQVLESFEFSVCASNAFDTINNLILLQKLELYGVSDRNRS